MGAGYGDISSYKSFNFLHHTILKTMKTRLYIVSLILIASILVGCTQQDFTPIKTPS